MAGAWAGAAPSLAYAMARGAPKAETTAASTMALTSARSSMRRVNELPPGRVTVSVEPSSAVAVALSSSEPHEALVLSRPSTTAFHVRCSVPFCMGAGLVAGLEVEAGSDVTGRGAGTGAGGTDATGAAALGAGAGAVARLGLGTGATAGAGALAAGLRCRLSAGGTNLGAAGFAGDDAGVCVGPALATDAAPVGAAAGAAVGTGPPASLASSAEMRSASDSSVRSLSGRAQRVSAISSTSRWFTAVRISLAASPSTVSTRASRSGLP